MAFLRALFYRFLKVLKMATTQQPSKLPLISVIGATGTGKSQVSFLNPARPLLHFHCCADRQYKQLAVDLALALNGEVINTDAMQMYAGLPIITNKPTPAEMRGVPHHLLGFLGLQEAYHVRQFVKVAEKTVGIAYALFLRLHFV